MEFREYAGDLEEALRMAIAGELKKTHTALPVIISETSKEGHSCKSKISIKALTITKKGEKEKIEYPELRGMPIQFMGGGGVTLTHPVHKDDEGIALFMSRPQDLWRDKGGTQEPIDNRIFNLSDSRFLPGGRSNPRKIKNFSKDTAHLRSDDGKHTLEQDPKAGMKFKTVDKDDKEKNPFKDAKKYYQGTLLAADGIEHLSYDKSGQKEKKNRHKITHKEGHVIAAGSDKHKTEIHPDKGIKSSVDEDKHHIDIKAAVTYQFLGGHIDELLDHKEMAQLADDLLAHWDMGDLPRLVADEAQGKTKGGHSNFAAALNPKIVEALGEKNITKLAVELDTLLLHKAITRTELTGSIRFMTEGEIDEQAKKDIKSKAQGKNTREGEGGVEDKGPTITHKGKTDLDGDTNVFGSLKASQLISAPQGVFGMLSGMMGGGGGGGGDDGTMGGNAMGQNAGQNAGIGAGGMAQDAAANNIGPLGGDLTGTLPNPHVLIASYTRAALPAPAAGLRGRQAVVTDAPAGLVWGDPVSATTAAGTAAYLLWCNGAAWTVLGK